MLIIEDYEIHRLTVPLGRVIGDNNCNYNVINVLAIALKTNQGHVGWGYGEAAGRREARFGGMANWDGRCHPPD